MLRAESLSQRGCRSGWAEHRPRGSHSSTGRCRSVWRVCSPRGASWQPMSPGSAACRRHPPILAPGAGYDRWFPVGCRFRASGARPRRSGLWFGRSGAPEARLDRSALLVGPLERLAPDAPRTCPASVHEVSDDARRVRGGRVNWRGGRAARGRQSGSAQPNDLGVQGELTADGAACRSKSPLRSAPRLSRPAARSGQACRRGAWPGSRVAPRRSPRAGT